MTHCMIAKVIETAMSEEKKTMTGKNPNRKNKARTLEQFEHTVGIQPSKNERNAIISIINHLLDS